MPAQPTGVWGIDLGQCGLKAMRLQEIDGQIVATAFDYVEHPKILSQPDADPDQLTREALDKFLSRNNLRGDIVAISVPGQSGLARFVKLPPVEEKKIADIVRFEAKQQIPFNLEEVVWDYQKIGSGIVTDGFAMETEIGLFAMKRDMVGRYLQHFKDVNVDVHLVQMAPLALCNYVAYDLLGKEAVGGGEGGESGDKKCIVALDIGSDSSNLVITDGERIIWQRPIPLGGNHFTRALTKDLKLTFAKAEHLKRNATKSPDLKKILAALRPVLNDFVGEVQRSLGYFTNTHRDAHIEYLIGLGNAFRLPGLQKFLSEKLQLEVKKLAKMERVEGDQVVAQPAFTENILTFAVAYGLALQGLKRARLMTNLLPQEIRTERLIKAKKPFAVTAAAALLLAFGGLALSYALEYRTYGDKKVEDAVKAAGEAKKKADTALSQFTALKQKVRDEEYSLRTIVAGQFERDNWAELYKYINTAIPQPDGKPRQFVVIADDGSEAEKIELDNIPKEFEAKYWDDKAKKAYQSYLSQQLALDSSKEEGRANEPAPGSENLIQFNIESVQTLFCDNLSSFWDQVKASKRVRVLGAELVRPKDNFQKSPQGAGWVVEIHGWTMHHDRVNFISNTLLENLARLGIRDKKADADAAPGAAPAAAPPVRPASGGAESKLESLGPVLNRVSHVVLFDNAQSSANPNAPFEILDSKHQEVRDLTLPAAASMSMGGQQAPPGGGSSNSQAQGSSSSSATSGGGSGGGPATASSGPSRSEWTPLGGEETGGRGGMMGAGGMNQHGPGGKAPVMLGPGMSGLRGGPNRGGGSAGGMPGMPRQPGGAPGAAPVDNKGPKRTEFVILFIWNEPTDSDDLRHLTSGDAGKVGGAAAASGGSPPRSRRPASKAKSADKKNP
ncbi:MAG: type IV pilus assembly protein PilM [Gemmataceae bacterium]